MHRSWHRIHIQCYYAHQFRIFFSPEIMLYIYTYITIPHNFFRGDMIYLTIHYVH